MEKSIDIDRDKFVYYKSGYYHYDCLLKEFSENNRLSALEAKERADKILHKTLENNIVKNSIDKDRLYFWLYENYNVTSFSKLFYMRMSDIQTGRFSENVTVPISYYDILQIFKKMKPYLEKQYAKNVRSGKKFDSKGRINYDLAIVVNNYDDYVKWKQKHKSRNTEIQKVKEELQVKQEINIDDIHINCKDDSNEINISEILDELF